MRKNNIRGNLTYSKTQKLKSSKSIKQLFGEGSSFAHFPLRILYMFQPADGLNLQTGFAVSAKNFKKAVDRNRIKRLMREAYRLQKNELEDILLKKVKRLEIFIIYTGVDLPGYTDIFNKTTFVIKKLNKIANENIA